MDKKRIILLSSLLGLAIALLGVLLLVLGRGKGSQPAVAAQPVLTQTAVITAAPTAEPTAAPTEDPRLMLSFGPVDRGVKELILPSVTEADLSLIRELKELTLLDGRACADGALLHAFSETVSYPVRWTVKLGGVSMDSEITELTVPAAVTSPEEVEAALSVCMNSASGANGRSTEVFFDCDLGQIEMKSRDPKKNRSTVTD